MVDVVSDIALVESDRAACAKSLLVDCLNSRDEAAAYVQAISEDVFSTG